MVDLIYKIMETVYGGGIAEKVSGFMAAVWEALTDIFDGSSLVESAYTTFGGVAAALMVLYFYMDIASQASRDLLTLEKLVVFCIKFLVAFMILLNSKPIMNNLLKLGHELYKSTTTTQIVSDEAMDGKDDHSWDKVLSEQSGALDDEGRPQEIVDAIEESYSGGFKKTINGLGIILTGSIGLLIGFVCQIICYLTCTTNALNICVRGFMAPLALPQLFEEGQRSAGVRYLKAFIAACLEMTLIYVTLRLASKLSTSLQPAAMNAMYGKSGEYLFTNGHLTDPTGAGIKKAFGVKALIPALIPQLAAAGAIAGVAKITHDITG